MVIQSHKQQREESSTRGDCKTLALEDHPMATSTQKKQPDRKTCIDLALWLPGHSRDQALENNIGLPSNLSGHTLRLRNWYLTATDNWQGKVKRQTNLAQHKITDRRPSRSKRRNASKVLLAVSVPGNVLPERNHAANNYNTVWQQALEGHLQLQGLCLLHSCPFALLLLLLPSLVWVLSGYQADYFKFQPILANHLQQPALNGKGRFHLQARGFKKVIEAWEQLGIQVQETQESHWSLKSEANTWTVKDRSVFVQLPSPQSCAATALQLKILILHFTLAVSCDNWKLRPGRLATCWRPCSSVCSTWEVVSVPTWPKLRLPTDLGNVVDTANLT